MSKYMEKFKEVAIDFGSGHWTYDQSELLKGNSLNNVFLRMNLGFRGGICLGLSMGFLLYTKRYMTLHPLIMGGKFFSDSQSAYESDGNFLGVSDLQTFIGTVMQAQKERGGGKMQSENIIPILSEGMFGVCLKHSKTRYVDWCEEDIAGVVFPRLLGAATYWLFGVRSQTGCHAFALSSRAHPTTGMCLLSFYEPNYGVVSFQGITAGAKFKQFMQRWISEELLGQIYVGGRTEIYEFN
jgi:hypothetical protein